MSEAVDSLHLTLFGPDSNAAPYLGEGWSGAERTHRWTTGLRSLVRLPPLRAQPWFALTLQGWGVNIGGRTPPQDFTLWLNGARLRRLRLAPGMPMALCVPGDLLRADGENLLRLDHPAAVRPSDWQAESRDTRLLSLAMQRLDVEPLDAPLAPAPRLLPRAPEPDAARAKEIAEMFQSRGQSCDLGNFQRHYGAEPYGLLRFAGIHPAELTQGLRTRFAGIGDADKLSFFNHDDSRELQGKHAIYGLNYHTFKYVDETDVAALVVSESRRLAYLARLFFEQLENDEKIFLRAEHFETPEEALALHSLLRAYHPRARLLVLGAAPAHLQERIGRVVELRPGLYRGYVSAMSEPQRVPPRPLHEEWMQICAAVAASA